jgi:xanthine dehydrogenase accessory factor
VDARVVEESAQVLADHRARVVTLSLGDEEAWEIGLSCAGTVEVLVEYYDPGSAHGVASALKLADDEVRQGHTTWIVSTLTAAPRRLVVLADGRRVGTLGTPELDKAAHVAVEAQGDRRSGVQEIGDQRLYFERHAPPLTLVVFGANHVAQPLVELAVPLGMRTVIVDGREVFATRERFPRADDILVGMPSEIAKRLQLNTSCMVVLLSHDYKYDLPVLRAVLESDAGYIGCLGSVRRAKALLTYLAQEGIPTARLARVHVPVGLDIGAKSAGEIALSVLAEGLAVLRKRPGGAMRNRLRGDA